MLIAEKDRRLARGLTIYGENGSRTRDRSKSCSNLTDELDRSATTAPFFLPFSSFFISLILFTIVNNLFSFFSINSIGFSRDWGLVAAGTAHGLVILDSFQKITILAKCTLNAHGNNLILHNLFV